ncbi:hypothetical protein [Embleya sp. NPDC020886]|uniref:hypothetical protein n=1 Tax=Embleya sp. NPDC020886 TaxID=3363980 RepID=UPI0037953E34
MRRRRTRTVANRAKFWNDRLAGADSAEERATVWQNACRSLAVQAERDGRDEVWEALAECLHTFFREHGQ